MTLQRHASPLADALGAVAESAWGAQPLEQLDLRALSDDMGLQLEALHEKGQVRVLTYRGAPMFLLLPLRGLPTASVPAALGDLADLDLPFAISAWGVPAEPAPSDASR